MRSLLLSLLVAVASPAAAQTPSPTSTDAQLSANLARGDLLYAYDQSAWHVTDAMLAAVPKGNQAAMRGYITTPDTDGYRTTFYGGEKGARIRLYSAVWTGTVIARSELLAPNSLTPVTAEEERLIKAREMVLPAAAKMPLCNKASPNLAVIPGTSAADPISVYVMTSQTKTTSVPLGGHYRVEVRDDKIIAFRKFTNSCIELEKPAGSKKQGTPVALIITHLLDPIPTEIHAFSVHVAGLPIYVGTTDGGMYEVGLRAGRAVVRKVK